MTMTRVQFFDAVGQEFGWQPTAWREEIFDDWAHQEGMPYEQTWNPLATTRYVEGEEALNQSYNIGFGPGVWNGAGVKVYATDKDGVTATVATLKLDFYPNIRRCFAAQIGYQEAVPEFATWVGSDVYGQTLVDKMNASTADKGSPPVPSLEQRVAVLERIVGGPAAVDYDLLASIQNTQKALQDHIDHHPAAGPHTHVTGGPVPPA